MSTASNAADQINEPDFDSDPAEGIDSELNGESKPKDANDGLRLVALLGVVICGFLQVMTLGGGDLFLMAATGALLTWFLAARQIAPLYILFVGLLVLRLSMIANDRRLMAFRDFGANDFLYNLFDSVTFVCIMAFGLIYYELAPRRLYDHWPRPEPRRPVWHRLEPFSGLLVRLPIAVACAILVYFLSGQLQSPINPRILAPKFAQTYLVVLILFVMFLLVRTLLDIWSWRIMKPKHARFFVACQIGGELGEELDLIKKPAWSPIDHPSAAGGMFMVQWMVALIMAVVWITYSRMYGNSLMWPAVAALFVLLTAVYNAIRVSRSDVAAEQHIISVVAFAVVSVVGIQVGNRAPFFPWAMLYFSWWIANAFVVARLSYLWLLDEYYARKNNWDRAKPFSYIRLGLLLVECGLAVFVIYVIGNELVVQFLNS